MAREAAKVRIGWEPVHDKICGSGLDRGTILVCMCVGLLRAAAIDERYSNGFIRTIVNLKNGCPTDVLSHACAVGELRV